MILSRPNWPPHPDDDKIIASNVAQLDGQLAQRRGHREVFTRQLPLDWHIQIHTGCQHVPSDQYVGHYRGEPLSYLKDCPVGVANAGGAIAFLGSPPHRVGSDLADLEVTLAADLAALDAKIPDPASAKPRIELVLEVMARHYATWIRVHPLVDGNGRTARVLANWLAVRYWQPLVIPGRPPTNRDGLIQATAPAVLNGNHRPLINELRRRLVAARKAAAAAQQQATNVSVAPFAGQQTSPTNP